MSEIQNTKNQQQTQQNGLLEGIIRFIRRTSGSPKESGTPRNGFLSYPAEWHAPAIAFGVGYAGTTEQARAVVAYSLGRGGAKKQLGEDSHIRDMADEPAYTLAALSLGRMARGAELVLPGLV